MAHAYHPSTGKADAEGLTARGSEASLGYVVNLMQYSQQPVLLLLHRREGGQTPGDPVGGGK